MGVLERNVSPAAIRSDLGARQRSRLARELDQDELIERWTLIGDDLERLASMRSEAKLGFALLLKFFDANGRFPRGRSELPSLAVEFVAQQLRVLVRRCGRPRAVTARSRS